MEFLPYEQISSPYNTYKLAQLYSYRIRIYTFKLLFVYHNQTQYNFILIQLSLSFMHINVIIIDITLKVNQNEICPFSETLLHHIDQYISDEVLEVVEKLSAAGNGEDLKKSLNMAKELRDYVVAIKSVTDEKMGIALQDATCTAQAELVQQLHSQLTTLQVLANDFATEIALKFGENNLQNVKNVITQLNEDLAVITVSQIPLQEPIQQASKILGPEITKGVETPHEILVAEDTKATAVDNKNAILETEAHSENTQSVILEQIEVIEEKPVHNVETIIDSSETFTLANTSGKTVGSEIETVPSDREVDKVEIATELYPGPAPLDELSTNRKDKAVKGHIETIGKLNFNLINLIV